MGYIVTNYVVLIVGMILISLFWNHLTKNEEPEERKKIRKYSIIFVILGVVMFTIQYFLF